MKPETIILSIHPRHIDKILTGEKLYEYRKRIPKEIRFIVVYATYPVRKIMALIEVDKILSDRPSTIWQMTSEFAGISQEFFFKYFEDKDISYAIKFKNIFKVEPALPIDILGYSNGPQSFIYLDIDPTEVKSLLHISNI